MSRRNTNEAEYHLLSTHQLEELRKKIIDEYLEKERHNHQWLEDELERVANDYDNMHAISLEKELAKLK